MGAWEQIDNSINLKVKPQTVIIISMRASNCLPLQASLTTKKSLPDFA